MHDDRARVLHAQEGLIELHDICLTQSIRYYTSTTELDHAYMLVPRSISISAAHVYKIEMDWRDEAIIHLFCNDSL